MLEQLSRAVMQLTAGAFAGVCLYIALVQQPVRMGLTAAAALTDFRAVIPRAEKVQAPLLIVSLVATAVQLAVAPSWPVASGGLLLLAVLVLTLATVLPINRRLLSGAATDHVAQVGSTLSRWGRLHLVRTGIAGAGAVAMWL